MKRVTPRGKKNLFVGLTIIKYKWIRLHLDRVTERHYEIHKRMNTGNFRHGLCSGQRKYEMGYDGQELLRKTIRMLKCGDLE